MTELSFECKIKKSIDDKYELPIYEIIIPCATRKMAKNFLKGIGKNEKKSRLWDEFDKSENKNWIKEQICLVNQLESEIKNLKQIQENKS